MRFNFMQQETKGASCLNQLPMATRVLQLGAARDMFAAETEAQKHTAGKWYSLRPAGGGLAAPPVL
jgi:hypothetical protein